MEEHKVLWGLHHMEVCSSKVCPDKPSFIHMSSLNETLPQLKSSSLLKDAAWHVPSTRFQGSAHQVGSTSCWFLCKQDWLHCGSAWLKTFQLILLNSSTFLVPDNTDQKCLWHLLVDVIDELGIRVIQYYSGIQNMSVTCKSRISYANFMQSDSKVSWLMTIW